MYSIFNELSQSILMHIDAARLTMMNLALDHCGIGASFDLETSYAIVVYIVLLKITLKYQL